MEHMDSLIKEEKKDVKQDERKERMRKLGNLLTSELSHVVNPNKKSKLVFSKEDYVVINKAREKARKKAIIKEMAKREKIRVESQFASQFDKPTKRRPVDFYDMMYGTKSVSPVWVKKKKQVSKPQQSEFHKMFGEL